MNRDSTRTAVIIGASSGIGEALAHELNRAGWRLGSWPAGLIDLRPFVKAFQSVYLDGLRDLARHSGRPIAVTEVQPGFIDTAMMKTDRPLPAVVRRLLVASPATAARQILRAVQKRKKHAYITRRYGVVAVILKLLPRAGWGNWRTK